MIFGLTTRWRTTMMIIIKSDDDDDNGKRILFEKIRLYFSKSKEEEENCMYCFPVLLLLYYVEFGVEINFGFTRLSILFFLRIKRIFDYNKKCYGLLLLLLLLAILFLFFIIYLLLLSLAKRSFKGFLLSVLSQGPVGCPERFPHLQPPDSPSLPATDLNPRNKSSGTVFIFLESGWRIWWFLSMMMHPERQ